MEIIYKLKKRCEESNDPVIKKLSIIAEDLVEGIKPHLKQITYDLPEFDIHDETHSEKILENINLILGCNILDGLSSYELFFMYLSAFFHDAAMALPKWERNLLRITEGQDNLYHDDVVSPLKHDGKAPMKLSEARSFINLNKQQIYNDFNNCKNYILCFNTEEELINDLSEQLCAYQNYRNGSINKLNSVKNNKVEYLRLSDEIRYEYIRDNHSIRIERLVNNLASIIDSRLSVNIGKKLTKTLGIICRSHGESFSYIKGLGLDDTYFGEESANVQFLCAMLRLGDIIHFSYDRAPATLYAEKMISSNESRKQWKVKSQGVVSNITNHDGIVKIKYDAYCDEPSFYYYLHKYFLWIEEEIDNYNKIIKTMEQSTEFNKLLSRYKINIYDDVDKKGVKYDEDIFEPVDDLCFKLNQSKILELLMGVNLYKDKFLCLREIYQNSLDACRNMICCFPKENGYIEFGLGEEKLNEIPRKFIYCLDNGMGMTKEIINKYFLNIGNSYYRSKDFFRENASHENKFVPTSQFGIGVLSCFMLGNKIYVSTKHKGDNSFTRFMIDGPHENFYYVKGNKFDDKEDLISNHGTIIKIYLKDDITLNDKYISFFDLISYMSDTYKYNRKYETEMRNQIESNLFYILQRSIRYTASNISVKIKLEDNKFYDLMVMNKPIIEYENFLSNEQIEELTFGVEYFENESKDRLIERFRNDKEKLHIMTICAEYEGVEFFDAIAIPKEKIGTKLLKKYNSRIESRLNVLVDGIKVNDTPELMELFNGTRHSNCIGLLNFTHEVRPQLSVDREKITSLDARVLLVLQELRKAIAKEVFTKVKSHILNFNIEFNSNVAMEIWEYVFRRYGWITEELVNEIKKSDEISIYLADVNKIGINSLSLKELIECEEYCYKQYEMRNVPRIVIYILMNKIASADKVLVSDDKITLKGCLIKPNKNIEIENWSMMDILVSADSFEGIYKEYDIVKNIHPVVKMDTYRSLIGKNISQISPKIKFSVRGAYNSVSNFIYSIDSRMVYPNIGIFSTIRRKASVGRKSEILRFSTAELFDEYDNEKKIDYFIYAYISPAELSQDDMEQLERYKTIDNEYYMGVINGWSILMLGSTGETIITPGLATKNDMLRKIDKSFWQLFGEYRYYLLDGTHITKEYTEALK